MYAIFEDGGKQYKVSEGDELFVETRELSEGQEELAFEQVLMVGEGADARIGQPWVENAKVGAKIVKALKGPKVTGVKFKRRKGYRLKFGHRQQLLRVKITSISV